MGRCVIHIGRRQSGKTTDALEEAMQSQPCAGWGPRIHHNAWPRLSLKGWYRQSENLRACVWECDPFYAIEYAMELCDVHRDGYFGAFVIDEAHRLWKRDKIETERVLGIVAREAAHTTADWHVTTQKFIGLPGELESEATELRIHRLRGRLDRYRAREYDVEDPADRHNFPNWTNGLPLEEIVYSPRMCHSFVRVDMETDELTFVACRCAAKPQRGAR